MYRDGAVTVRRDVMGSQGPGFTAARCKDRRMLWESHRQQPDTGEPVPSFLLGELGVRMVADADPERIFQLIETNISRRISVSAV